MCCAVFEHLLLINEVDDDITFYVKYTTCSRLSFFSLPQCHSAVKVSLFFLRTKSWTAEWCMPETAKALWEKSLNLKQIMLHFGKSPQKNKDDNSYKIPGSKCLLICKCFFLKIEGKKIQQYLSSSIYIFQYLCLR